MIRRGAGARRVVWHIILAALLAAVCCTVLAAPVTELTEETPLRDQRVRAVVLASVGRTGSTALTALLTMLPGAFVIVEVRMARALLVWG